MKSDTAAQIRRVYFQVFHHTNKMTALCDSSCSICEVLSTSGDPSHQAVGPETHVTAEVAIWRHYCFRVED